MKTENLISVSMTIDDALSIVKDYCIKHELPEEGEFKFNGWDNKIPGELLGDGDMIKMTFKKS